MCCPEHMWRIGPAFSPSRASPGGGQRIERRALGPAGEERLAHAGAAVDPLERPDVEVLAGMRAGQDRDLGRLEVEGLDPAGLDQRQQAERLDRRAQRHDAIRVPELADDPAGHVGLDDVAAMDALLDAVAEVPGEDRRCGPAPGGGPGRWPPGSRAGWGGGCGHGRSVSGSDSAPSGAGSARIPRRLLRWVGGATLATRRSPNRP